MLLDCLSCVHFSINLIMSSLESDKERIGERRERSGRESVEGSERKR